MAILNKRKLATDYIVDNIHNLLPDGYNRDRTRKYLDGLSLPEFEQFLKDLKSEKKFLTLIAPNSSKVKLDLKRNFELAKKLGIKLYQRIWLPTPDGNGEYLTQDPYLIVRLPVRRQSQLLIKKASIPENNRVIDALTGQPAGESKGAKITMPELQMMASVGLKRTLTEFLKFRGGDLKGFSVMYTSLGRTGGVSQDAIEPYSGVVIATRTLSHLLTAAHLRNNLNE